MPTTGSPNTQLRKVTTIETVANLLANQVFTGLWHDSQEDGTIAVQFSAFGTQASAANGFTIQESDDITNANFTRNLFITTMAVSTLLRPLVFIKARFWRIVFTNGATAQTSLEITSCAMNFVPGVNPSDENVGANVSGPIEIIMNPGSFGSITDNNTSLSTALQWMLASGAAAPGEVFVPKWGGGFSGTIDTVRQGWSKDRTPTVFKQLSTAAVGPTALWTPSAGNKFRLLRYMIEVSANAAAAAAGVLVIKLLDAAGDIAQDHSVFIPAAAATAFGVDDFIPMDLGSFGILSALANNVLNITLSFALTAGVVNVIVMGVEE